MRVYLVASPFRKKNVSLLLVYIVPAIMMQAVGREKH